MKVFPNINNSEIISIEDYGSGVCEGGVAKRDAFEVITTVRPWLRGRVVKSVVVFAKADGSMCVETDSRDVDGGLVRSDTIFDLSMRPTDPLEATRFDSFMSTLGRVARNGEVDTAATSVPITNKRSAA